MLSVIFSWRRLKFEILNFIINSDHFLPGRKRERFRTLSENEYRGAKESGPSDQLAPVPDDRSSATYELLRASSRLRVAVHSRFGEPAVEDQSTVLRQ